MGDFLRLVLDSIHFLWPFVIVHQWEKGVYLLFGRTWKIVNPGLYPRLPWFTDIHCTSVAWEPVSTGRKDITAKDGRWITYEATAWFRVVDPVKALVLVHDYEHGMVQLVSSALSEKLAEVEVERFLPERRSRLNTSLVQMVEAEALEYGIEVKWLRFTTFVIGAKTFRLITEHGLV